MGTQLVMIGAGGHARVVHLEMQRLGLALAAVIAPQRPDVDDAMAAIPWYSDDADIEAFSRDSTRLINGLGHTPGFTLRKTLYDAFVALGYRFQTLIASTAIVAEDMKTNQGVQVLARAVVNCGVTLGTNVLVNTGAIIEHDVVVGAHSSVSPGAVVCGGVQIAEHVFVGAGSTIIQGVSIGAGSVIGAGAVVTKDVPANTTVYPARSFYKMDKST